MVGHRINYNVRCGEKDKFNNSISSSVTEDCQTQELLLMIDDDESVALADNTEALGDGEALVIQKLKLFFSYLQGPDGSFDCDLED